MATAAKAKTGRTQPGFPTTRRPPDRLPRDGRGRAFGFDAFERRVAAASAGGPPWARRRVAPILRG